jgi:ATP-dependent Clp protease protease subunit
MHPAGGGAQGYAPDVEIQYKELKRMQDLLHGILSRHTGQTLEQIAGDFERDRFMDAHGAKDYGMVDEILGEAAIEPMESANKKNSKKD